MANVAKNIKSITLENVEVLYHEKSDTLSIISSDPDLPKGEFFMKVKEGTPTDIALRKLFAEKTGVTKPLEASADTDSSDTRPLSVSDAELHKHGKYEFPLGRTKSHEEVSVTLAPDSNSPNNVLIVGRTGHGKTVLLQQIKRKAKLSNIPVLSWSSKSNRESEYSFISGLVRILESSSAQPTVVMIDGLESYLKSDSIPNHLRDLNMLRLARSKNIKFIFATQRVGHDLLQTLEPFLSTKIVGYADTISSAILLGTNEAVKLKGTGNFIVKTHNETKVMKAYLSSREEITPIQ